MTWIVRALINIQQHLHIRNKSTVLLWWNYPSFVLPGLDFVFLKLDGLFHERCFQCSLARRPCRPVASKTTEQNLLVAHCNSMQSNKLRNLHQTSWNKYDFLFFYQEHIKSRIFNYLKFHKIKFNF